jgi:monoamine oxidase
VKKVLVIGGGIAGLAAAQELSDCKVVLVEARERLGGRIHTIPGQTGLGIELGAEFVHGRPPALWDRIKEAHLPLQIVPDRHWKFHEGILEEIEGIEEELGAVFQDIPVSGPDYSLATILRRSGESKEIKEIARDYVEGFHAARIEEASAKAIACSQQKSEETHGEEQFRVEPGYNTLVNWFQERCRAKGVVMALNTKLLSLEWKRGAITCSCESKEEVRRITGAAAIITLPLGVLKSGAVEFTPRLTAIENALRDLRMGSVAKITLHFREPFWPEPNFGFIHSDNRWLPTWWSDARGNLLTGWAGGPKGENLAAREAHFIKERAFEALSRIFAVPLPHIADLFLESHTHNWAADPYSLGAYSFIPVNGMEAVRELARPVESTLFFAGEATDLDYEFGTVHGALNSGVRAARELMLKL